MIEVFLRANSECWIKELWGKSNHEIEETYNEANYSITMENASLRSRKVAQTLQFLIKKQ